MFIAAYKQANNALQSKKKSQKQVLGNQIWPFLHDFTCPYRICSHTRVYVK
jgi:hypothetical protein